MAKSFFVFLAIFLSINCCCSAENGTVPITCEAPSNIVKTGGSISSVTLSWDNATNAIGYLVRIECVTDGTLSTAVNITNNTYTFTGLAPGKTYRFHIATDCGSTTNFIIAEDFIL